MAYRATASTKKLVSSSDETALRKKVLELHANDVIEFDDESLLASIEGILNHVMPGDDAPRDDQGLTDEAGKLRRIIAPPGPDGLLDTLPYLLHQITCVLNCKCSGGDGHASALEILQLLEHYKWEAKIVIILASFVVEYGQYNLVARLYKSDPLAKLVAMLKQIPDESDEIFASMKSKFETIINLVKVSIEVTRFIAKFGCFPSKYISNDAEPMVMASNQIPIAVYWMTRVVVACASEYAEIVGKSEVTSSYTETWSVTTLHQKITTIQTSFQTHYDACSIHIAEKKQIRYVEKLKTMFGQTTVYIDNQKILQTIMKKKDGLHPLSCGPQVETKISVEALKGKTVLLLISDLEISIEEINQIKYFYKERKKSECHYEIVWLPIVEKIEETKEFDDRVVELKCSMPWHSLEHPRLIKQGFVKYVREEWRYSKKSIMVSIDQRGKVAHQNALHMMWTWGNAVYPFTHRREAELWSRKEWSLKLLVEETNEQMTTWIKDNKFICVFGGDDYAWIEEFLKAASDAASATKTKLEMVYIYKKNTTQEHITRITEILSKRSVLIWEKAASTYFWKRMECMLYSKVHHGAKITTAKEPGDAILTEVISMLTLGDHDKGWGLVSHGAGAGAKMIAKAKGDVMVKALGEFESWSGAVREKGFATALHEHLAGRVVEKHHCNRLTLPGIEDIGGTMICAECQRPMEKYIMYRCCVE
ncbi:protein SIEVE ELEMENT OCCLUSION B-like [Salvia miltiorrhiza]|uniref:protein SIEVE ELEMENT OCCLUSION B-like n=1 Tax=Salvia miltiorrhiza TaxID=226208 RepID=UPI0025ACE65C|nr:protein SIEVE ELEMENT OCCLUSION B-like [Salvia miltiorrhiza]